MTAANSHQCGPVAECPKCGYMTMEVGAAIRTSVPSFNDALGNNIKRLLWDWS